MFSPEQLPTTDPSSSAQKLREMIVGFQASQLLYVAAKLGIAEPFGTFVLLQRFNARLVRFLTLRGRHRCNSHPTRGGKQGCD